MAEDQLKCAFEVGLANQYLPIEMSDLVTKVAKQRPIGFAKRDAPEFAFGVVGLRQIQRNEAGQMPGQDWKSRGLVRQDVEGNLWTGRNGKRKIEPAEIVDQASLRRLDPFPQHEIAIRSEIGNGPRETTGMA